MTKKTIDVIGYLHKLALEPDSDFVRESLKVITQLMMEADVTEQIGARKHERAAERTNQRNGYRTRKWETRVGERDPEVATGKLLPGLVAGTTATGRARVGECDPAGVHPGSEYPEGGSLGAGVGVGPSGPE